MSETKIILWICFYIFEIYIKFWTFSKKDDPHSWCISELRTPKNVFKQMSEKSRFRGPFDKQHGKEGQTILKCKRHQFYHNYWSLWRQLRLKKILLVTCKVLRLIVNVLTADDKCFLLNRDNLRQPIQMHLSEKQKTFSELFSENLKSRLNFEHFPKKEHHNRCISEMTDSKNVVK